jgi:hypothetical protein
MEVVEMGQARVRQLNGMASNGDNWKWLQRDFEERPVQFMLDGDKNPISHPYINPAIKRLNRKMRGIEKKYEATNHRAILSRSLLVQRLETMELRKVELMKRLNPLK